MSRASRLLSICLCAWLVSFHCLQAAQKQAEPHITERYPAAFSIAAQKHGVALKAPYPRAIEANLMYKHGSLQPLALKGGPKTVLRIVLEDVSPGDYILGVYVSLGDRTSLAKEIKHYHVQLDGQRIALRDTVPDLIAKDADPDRNRIVSGTLLSTKAVTVANMSTVDIWVGTGWHAIGKILLFRREEDVARIAEIAEAYRVAQQAETREVEVQPQPHETAVEAPPPLDAQAQAYVRSAEQGVTIARRAEPGPVRVPLTDRWVYFPVSDVEQIDSFPPADAAWQPTSMPTGEKDAAGAWYRLRFTIDPPDDLDPRGIALVFDRVMTISDIYIDRKKIGSCWSGSERFLLNLTPHVTPGKQHELLVGVKHPKGLKKLAVTYGHWIKPRNGILAAPELVISKGVLVDWVFVKPSVRTMNLAVDTHLLNTGASDAAVQVKHTVFTPYNSRPLRYQEALFSFTSQEQTLKAGEEASISAAEPWKNAKLWWPHAPEVYSLKTEVLVDGEVIDTSGPQVFGFREVWLDGVHIMFNNKKLFLRGWDVDRNYERLHHREQEMFRYIGLNPEIPTRFIAPEFEIMTHRPWDDPLFWKQCQAHVQGWARKLCNNPAILIYSLSNEVLHCGQHHGHPELPQRLSELGKALAAVDPTRPYMFNGDGDLLGDQSVPVINLHYPRMLSQARLLPDDVRWIDGTGDIPIDSNIGKITWHRKRPLYLGETWWTIFDGAPWAYSTHFGEKVYEGYEEHTPYRALTAGFYMDHYRVNGIAGFTKWAMHNAKVRPIEIVDEKYRYAYHPGTVKREFHLVNQTLVDYKFLVSWRLEDRDGTLHDAGRLNLALAGGETAPITIPFLLPAVPAPTEFVLRCRVSVGGKYSQQQFPIEREWTFISVPASVKLGGDSRVSVFDLQGNAAEALQQLGVQVNRIQDLTTLPPGSLLVVRGDDSHRLAPDALDRFVATGGRLLYLRTASGLVWTPLPLQWSRQEANFAFIRSPNHPAMQGLSDRMFSLWNPGFRVGSMLPRKPCAGRYRILLESGSATGLQYAPLLELPHGKGVCLVSQLPLVEKMDSEPMARHVLAALIRYISGYQAPTHKRMATVLPTRHQRFVEDRVGVVCTDIAGTDQPLKGFDVLMLHASAYQGPVAPVRDFVQQGGTLMLRALTPEARERFGDMLPAQVTVRERAFTQTLRRGTPGLLDGLSHEDMLWARGSVPNVKINASIVTHELIGCDGPEWQSLTQNFQNDHKHWHHNTEAGELYSDGAAVAVGRMGKGTIILDQVNWDHGMAYAEEKLKRIVSCMAGNLGVQVLPVTDDRAWKHQSLTLKPNRTLKEWMGWKQNDMRRLPTGRIELGRVPFEIPVQGPQVCMLRSEEAMRDMPADIPGIQANAKADTFCFLHTCTYGFDFEYGKLVLAYHIAYDDGTEHYVRIAYGIDIHDWQRPCGPLSDETRVVWDGGTEEHAHAYVYLTTKPNPYPDKSIKSIDIVAGKSRAVPVVLGITLGTQEKRTEPSGRERPQGGMWRTGESAAAEAQHATIHHWAVAGPFANPVDQGDPLGSGLSIPYGPEQVVNLKASYAGKDGPAKWVTTAAAPLPKKGHVVSLKDMYSTTPNWAVAYAFTRVFSPEEQEVTLLFGSDDGARVWFNRKEIISVHAVRAARLDEHTEKLTLNKGWNDLLIKVEQLTGGWSFKYHFTGDDGKPMDELRCKVEGTAPPSPGG